MNPNEFFEKIKTNPRPVVVDFWAPWCMPCRMMEPAMKKVEKEYHERVDVWRINADEAPELLKELKIFGIPTLVGYRQGQEVQRRSGARSQSDLTRFFETVLTGEIPTSKGLSSINRVLRLSLGLLLIVFGWAYGSSWILMLAGAVVMFSGVYDRCPVWNALAPRMARVLRLKGS
jgi:thioredoxin